MKRPLLILLTGASLLVCAAAAALWVRCHWTFDFLLYTWDQRGGRNEWLVASQDGSLRVELRTASSSVDRLRVRINRNDAPTLGPPNWPELWDEVPPRLRWYRVDVAPAKAPPPLMGQLPRFVMRGGASLENRFWHRYGFGWWRERRAEFARSVLLERQGVEVPFLFIAALAAVTPAVVLLVVFRRRRRERSGRCPDCGYDVRATSRQCPECGRILDASPRPT